MATPLVIRFADGSERCLTCKGFGLVRGQGPRAGEHYRTLAGAQAALEHGNAVDCPRCEGGGVVEPAQLAAAS